MINNLTGSDTAKQLQAGTYKINNESTNRVSKIWRYFKLIVEPSDLLFIQSRNVGKKAASQQKAISTMKNLKRILKNMY